MATSRSKIRQALPGELEKRQAPPAKFESPPERSTSSRPRGRIPSGSTTGRTASGLSEIGQTASCPASLPVPSVAELVALRAHDAPPNEHARTLYKVEAFAKFVRSQGDTVIVRALSCLP